MVSDSNLPVLKCCSNLLADDVEKERQDFLEKLDACAAPRKQVHELEWELKKRADEIRDVQKV